MSGHNIAPQDVIEYWFPEGNDHTIDTAIWFQQVNSRLAFTSGDDTHQPTLADARSRFGPLVEMLSLHQSSDGEAPLITADHPLADWQTTPSGHLALALAAGPTARLVRHGTAQMFKLDALAEKLATALLRPEWRNLGPDNLTPWPEAVGPYLILMRSEDVASVEVSFLGIVSLIRSMAERQAADAEAGKLVGRTLDKTIKLLQRQASRIKSLRSVLNTFGRNPFLNHTLGRESTPEEYEWLCKSTRQKTKSWMAPRGLDIGPLPSPPGALRPNSTVSTSLKRHIKSGTFRGTTAAAAPRLGGPKLRVLALHGNRQSAGEFRKRTASFAESLADVATLTIVDAPHVRQGSGGVTYGGDEPRLGGRLRCWWDAVETEPGVYEYRGMSASLEYLGGIWEEHGGFDGVLGFSQGAALAGLLASMPAAALPASIRAEPPRFVVCLSGFYCRDRTLMPLQLDIGDAAQVVHQPDELRPLVRTSSAQVPSFHVVGNNDVMVEPWRSEALAAVFKDSEVHYSDAPDHWKRAVALWPVEALRTFLGRFPPRPATEAAETLGPHPDPTPSGAGLSASEHSGRPRILPSFEERLKWVKETRTQWLHEHGDMSAVNRKRTAKQGRVAAAAAAEAEVGGGDVPAEPPTHPGVLEVLDVEAVMTDEFVLATDIGCGPSTGDGEGGMNAAEFFVARILKDSAAFADMDGADGPDAKTVAALIDDLFLVAWSFYPWQPRRFGAFVDVPPEYAIPFYEVFHAAVEASLQIGSGGLNGKGALLTEAHIQRLPAATGSWRPLTRLTLQAFTGQSLSVTSAGAAGGGYTPVEEKSDSQTLIHKVCVVLFSSQLHQDMQQVEHHHTLEGQGLDTSHLVSHACEGAPSHRHSSAYNRTCENAITYIGRRLERLQCGEDGDGDGDGGGVEEAMSDEELARDTARFANVYKDTLKTIARHLRETNKDRARTKRRNAENDDASGDDAGTKDAGASELALRLKTLRQSMLADDVTEDEMGPEVLQAIIRDTPLSNAVLNPTPEPVAISRPDQLAPLFNFLQTQSPLPDPTLLAGDANLSFTRGTVCSDGRLDLCKQVIGPNGVPDLMASLRSDSAPGGAQLVKHILLGNNIAGDGLCDGIAELIRSGGSTLTTWYIAGNRLTAEGISTLCEVLMNDDQVLQLWLKRNPLRPVAGPILGDLLAANTTLAVLDLVNCGLLDDGVSSVFDGLEASGDASALEHLYLDGNGIRFEACTRIGAFLRQGKGRLKTLSLGCSRMGDSGLKLLADALMEPGAVPLTRLCVASCGISSVGANCLAALLDPASKGSEARAPPSLRRLDVGMLKMTGALGECPNFIGDDGARALAASLSTNRTLRSLSLVHNQLSILALQAFADLASVQNDLVHLELDQFGYEGPAAGLGLGAGQEGDKGGAGGGEQSVAAVHLHEVIRISLKHNYEKLTPVERLEADEAVDPQHLEEIASVYRLNGSYKGDTAFKSGDIAPVSLPEDAVQPSYGYGIDLAPVVDLDFGDDCEGEGEGGGGGEGGGAGNDGEPEFEEWDCPQPPRLVFSRSESDM